MAANYPVVAVDQQRICPAILDDAGGQLGYLRLGVRTSVATIGDQRLNPPVFDVQDLGHGMQKPASVADPQLIGRLDQAVTRVVTGKPGGNLILLPDGRAMLRCRSPHGILHRKDPLNSSGRLQILTRKRRRPQFPVAFDVCWSLLATLAAMVAKFPENVAALKAHEFRVHPHDSTAIRKRWQFHVTSLRQAGTLVPADPFRLAATVVKAFCHSRHAVLR